MGKGHRQKKDAQLSDITVRYDVVAWCDVDDLVVRSRNSNALVRWGVVSVQ